MNTRKKEKLFRYLARYFDSMDYPPILLWKNIPGGRIKSAWRRRAREILKGALDYPALYVHIPYCQTKCFFCKFRVRVANSAAILDHYLKCLYQEIEELSPLLKGVTFTTLYLGGGTPTILTAPQTDKLLTLLEKRFNLENTRQRLIEATPATLSPEKLRVLKQHGINRLTIGIQILDRDLLIKINRRNQTPEMVERIYKQARKAKIEYINVDLVVGLPEQTRESFLKDVNFVLRLRPDAIHIFAYEEEDLVIFYQMGKRLTDKDRQERDEMYALADQEIIKSGYRAYKGESYLLSPQAANYQFLLRYRVNGSMLGLGAKALSYIPGYYAYQNAQIEEYLEYRGKGKYPPYVSGYPLNKAETRTNYIINNIRGGLDTQLFHKIYGVDFRKIYAKEIEILKKLNRWQEKGDRVRIRADSDEEFRTYSKFFFSPTVIARLQKEVRTYEKKA